MAGFASRAIAGTAAARFPAKMPGSGDPSVLFFCHRAVKLAGIPVWYNLCLEVGRIRRPEPEGEGMRNNDEKRTIKNIVQLWQRLLVSI